VDRVVLPGDRGEEAIAPRRLGLATLLVFDLVLFAPLLARGRVLSSHEFVRAHHPWRATDRGVRSVENPLLADPAASGETTLVRYRDFPRGFFWNPWISAGSIGPFHLAQGFLSPFVAIPSLVVPEAWIETAILFLKFNFAYLAAWLFLRGRGFPDFAAAAGAAAWAFSTGQTVWGLWMQTSVAVTDPLLLAAVDRSFEEERPARAVAFASIAFLLFLAGGFPHWILYGAFAGVLYFLIQALRGGRAAVPAFLRLSLAAAVSLAILLPSIVASARFVSASGYQEVRKGMGSSFALPLRHLRLYFLPDYQGNTRRGDYRGVGWIPGDNYVETAAGVGLVAGALAAIGLFSRKRRMLVTWAATLAAAVAIPLYGGGPVLRLVGSVPFLDNALFARSKILIVLAVAILAACGAEALERVAEGSSLRALALRAAPFLIAVPLAFHALDFHPVAKPADAVFTKTPGIEKLEEVRRRAPSRFAAAGWTLLPNVAEVFGLEDARGHLLHDAAYRRLLSAADANSFGRYGTYLLFHPRSLDPGSPILDLLNVTTLAAPPGVPVPTGRSIEPLDAAAMEPYGPDGRPEPDPERFPRIYAGGDLTLFARPSAFPRFRLVTRALAGGVEEVRSADRATLATAVFVAPDLARRLAASESSRGSAGSVEVVALEPERFHVETGTPLPTLFVSSQKRFDPYSRFFVDGRPVEGFAANGLFFGVELTAGHHRIEGRFAIPRGELAISGIGLIVFAVVLFKAVLA
jgi:hypothetical protein